MQEVEEVEAILGVGLKGDRYATGKGTWNKGQAGKRQVTFINAMFFEGTSYEFADSRRNVVTVGIELMYLIGREFWVGNVRFRGVKYCDPCERPTKLAGEEASFRKTFFDRGGLIAEILQGGAIRKGFHIMLPPRAEA
jgi:MOSC domain-containing protein YiiM